MFTATKIKNTNLNIESCNLCEGEFTDTCKACGSDEKPTFAKVFTVAKKEIIGMTNVTFEYENMTIYHGCEKLNVNLGLER